MATHFALTARKTRNPSPSLHVTVLNENPHLTPNINAIDILILPRCRTFVTSPLQLSGAAYRSRKNPKVIRKLHSWPRLFKQRITHHPDDKMYHFQYILTEG